MKAIVVYYSYEGNTALVARAFQKNIGAELLEIKTEDEKKRSGFAKYVWGGRQVFLKEKPALRPYSFDASTWELIILGCPVWAGRPAPAMAAFIERAEISGKKVALFCCHAGGKGKALDKFEEMLRAAAKDAPPVISGKTDFINPLKLSETEIARKITALELM